VNQHRCSASSCSDLPSGLHIERVIKLIPVVDQDSETMLIGEFAAEYAEQGYEVLRVSAAYSGHLPPGREWDVTFQAST
jgi:hypothetical protein